MIDVKVNILGRRPGSVVKAGDRDFETFKRFAEKKSIKGGALICTMKDPSLFDRPAATARLEELGIEFRGNMSNDNMAQLLLDSEAAAEDKEGDDEFDLTATLARLEELGIEFEEGLGEEELKKLLEEVEAAVLVKGESEFSREFAINKLNELEVDFEEGLDDEQLEQILKDVEADLEAGPKTGDEGSKEETEELAAFDRDAAKARLKELNVKFAGNISNVKLEQLLKYSEAAVQEA